MEPGFKLGRCHTNACLCWKLLCSGSLQMSLQTYSFSPTPLQALRGISIPGPLWMRCTHGRCPTAVCWPRAGFQKGEEGVASSIKNRSQFSTSSTAQLPGYCPRPGRHLLWVISICMAIITAFGKKIPLSKSPAELLMPAQNWRRQLRQTPSRLLLITDNPGGCLSPTPSHSGAPREHGNFGQYGPLSGALF